MNSFSLVFLALLGASLATQLWLARRHLHHVARHRAAVPAAFADKIPLSAHQKAADYTLAKVRFGRIDGLIGAALLVVWTLGGGLELLDQAWQSFGFSPLVTGTAFILSAFLLMGLLELPASLYQTFVLEARFGFNKTTPATFVADLIKQALLVLALGAPLTAAVLWLMQQTGTLWWLYVWLLWAGFGLLMMWAYPTLIAPLFNKFRPLEDGQVQARIHALLERTGFTSRGIFVMDGSRRTAHGNAYFTGLGRNKRIVFFDNLLKTLVVDEIEAVLAHELGHYKRRHVVKRMLLGFAMSLAGLALLGWLSDQSWFYQGLGMRHASPHAALVLFLMAMPVFTFFVQPLMAWGSRRHEFQADDFAAEQADAKAMVSALVKLYEENASTLTPDPLYSAFYDSHPPAALRIAHLQAASR
ncbi:MAG: M48 family metallopeptidase [Gammaproteobacteria bacterium]|nr:M48 family metallopeptidase [Gammaproteobacteria bacterium]